MPLAVIELMAIKMFLELIFRLPFQAKFRIKVAVKDITTKRILYKNLDMLVKAPPMRSSLLTWVCAKAELIILAVESKSTVKIIQ